MAKAKAEQRFPALAELAKQPDSPKEFKLLVGNMFFYIDEFGKLVVERELEIPGILSDFITYHRNINLMINDAIEDMRLFRTACWRFLVVESPILFKEVSKVESDFYEELTRIRTELSEYIAIHWNKGYEGHNGSDDELEEELQNLRSILDAKVAESRKGMRGASTSGAGTSAETIPSEEATSGDQEKAEPTGGAIQSEETSSGEDQEKPGPSTGAIRKGKIPNDDPKIKVTSSPAQKQTKREESKESQTLKKESQAEDEDDQPSPSKVSKKAKKSKDDDPKN